MRKRKILVLCLVLASFIVLVGFAQAALYAGTSNPAKVYEYTGGTNWNEIFSSTDDYAVLCLAGYNGKLYAGTMSTSNPLNGVGRVYRYDGNNTWTLVGNNMNDQVCSLAVYQGDLYAGSAWDSMRLYKYTPGTTGGPVSNWTLAVDYTAWDGTRSLHVSHGYLLMGDIKYDRFGRWDGSNFYADLDGSGSCIYDYEDYNGNVYAAAYRGLMWNSPDAINWNVLLGSYDGNMWELEEFQSKLYMSYANGELRSSAVPDRGTLVYKASDDIISMTTGRSNLYFGIGGEAGALYGSSTTGTGKVYKYSGTGTPTLISGSMGTGVQVLVDLPCPPAIDVNKTVWDPVTGEWKKAITAKVCDTMRFNCSIHARCCNLTNVVVTDILSDSLEYAGNPNIPPYEVRPGPGGTTIVEWRFPILDNCSTTYIEFDAHKKLEGCDNNTQHVTAWCNETEPHVQVNGTSTVDIFDIDVNKTVWNPAIPDWDTSRVAKVSEDVMFKCEVHPKCCNLTNVVVTDILSESMNYTGTKNITVDGAPITPVTPTVEPGPENTTVVTWNFTDLTLEKSQTLTIIFDAHKVKSECDNNTQIVEGKACNRTWVTVKSNTVDIFDIDVNKTVWNPAIPGWDTSRVAKVSEDVMFKCEVHPKCCNLTNVVVTDILSESMNYTDTKNITLDGAPITPVTPTVEPRPENTTVVTWNFTDLTLEKSQTLTIIFDAHKVKPECDNNTQIVEGKACNRTWVTVKSNTVDIFDIDVNKTVWNPAIPGWDTSRVAKVSEDVMFKCEVHPKCCNLTNVVVTDILSVSLNYIDTKNITLDGAPITPVTPTVEPGPENTTVVTWNFTDLTFEKSQTLTIIFDAHKVKPECDNNTQIVEGKACNRTWVTVKSNTVDIFDIDVNKTVWNPAIPGWDTSRVAKVSEDVMFKCEVHPKCCNLTNVVVTDILSESMNYTDTKNITLDGAPITPVTPTVEPGPENTTVVTWNFTDLTLEKSQTLTIIFDAHKVKPECDNNTQIVEGKACNRTWVTVKSNTVDIFDIDVNKTVWNPAIPGWDTSRVAKVSEDVMFKCEVHPKCCNLTNVVVTDILSVSLNYIDTKNITLDGAPITPVTPTVEPGPENTTVVTWNFTDLTLEKSQTLTIIFDAHKVKCGNNTNIQIVEGKACNKTWVTVANNTVDIICKQRISVDPPETVVQPQAQFDVNITVDPACHCVYGVQYDLYYNTNVVWAETQNKGPFLGNYTETWVAQNVIDNYWDEANHIGRISYAETRKENESGVTEAGILTTIQFTAIGERGDIGNLNLSDVIIVDCNKTQNYDLIIENGTVEITNNTPPVAVATSKHRTNNCAKKYPSLTWFCACQSEDDDYPGKGGNITYIRWAFGDGQYGECGWDNCQKEHSYESWQWAPFGVPPPGGNYEPFEVVLTVRDDGCPEEEGNDYMDVHIYIAGDANGDGRVNILDAVYVGKHWNERCDDGGYVPDPCCYYWEDGREQQDAADLNNDCVVNILDAVRIGAMWGHTAW